MNDAHPSDVGAGDNEINAGNTIEDNWFHHDTVEYHGGSGMVVGYTQHTLITHNQFNDLPYDGLDFGWGGWHTNSSAPTADTNINRYNTISNNLVFNYKTVLADGGGIYTNGNQGTTYADGLQETGNVVYGQHNVYWALYNDRGSDYVTLNGNAEWNSPSGYGGCAPVGHIVLENNYLADSIGIGGGCGPYPIDITQTNNTTISDNPTPGQLPATLLSNAGVEASYAGLITSATPEVDMSSPNTGTASQATQVFISGSGFTANSTQVFFQRTAATQVNVISPNFIIATAPAGAVLSSVFVLTAASPTFSSTTHYVLTNLTNGLVLDDGGRPVVRVPIC